MSGPQANWLPDGRRLHLNHGPIDLIVEAFGEAAELRAAYRQCVARFETILTELVDELPELRRPACRQPRPFAGATARRMEAAVVPLADVFITPMAAVAGSVADEMLAATVLGRDLERAYVNDGGDIALFIAPGGGIDAAIAGTGRADRLTIRAEDRVRGIATSGWHGRSFSLGIADAVTVLADNAAAADAAATLIANAVDLPGHPAIGRRPARQLAPDSDLGDRLVTTAVAPLGAGEVAAALDAGLQAAEDFRRRGLIEAAALFLDRDARFSGLLPPQLDPDGGRAKRRADPLLSRRGEVGRARPGKETVSMPTKEIDHA
ncbi:UPF0280 family protein [Aminobacter sp. BE322]|uniref:UPF0280 family protein n=1 Tax=unclassified Aminobacter TaxID=2644704 RepID=UPI003D1D7AC8